MYDPNDPANTPHLYTDYVLGYNLPPDPTYGDAAQQDLLSSGNIVKVISASAGNAALRLASRLLPSVFELDAGEPTYTIETLDPFLPPPHIDDVWGKWWLVGWATLSAYDWDRNVKARLKWPFFDGYGCPLMVLGKGGTNRVPQYWCAPVANGTELPLYTV